MKDNCPRCQCETQVDDVFCGGCGYNLGESIPAVAGTQLDIKVTDVQLSLAMVYFKNDKFDECLGLLRKVLLQDAENSDALALIDRVQEAKSSDQPTATQPALGKE